MSTLAALKADIAADIGSTDYTTDIASAISSAIRHYQAHRFYFNESREKTFATVADQVWYSSSDDADIGLIKQVDALVVETATYDRSLIYVTPEALEILTDGNVSSNEPIYWTYYNQQIGLYPPPDAAYTIRIMGLLKLAEPASDGEANNGWMTEAYDLIRARALASLLLFKLQDADRAGVMRQVEMDELRRIERETERRLATGMVSAMAF